MILIADSGSTKTDWRLIRRSKEIEQAKSAGFNPFYQSSDEIYKELEEVLVPQINDPVKEIYFYGAGCANEEKCSIVKVALKKAFPDVETIEVTTDLYAAARALCNSEPGIACILGTGANSCVYDGSKIIANKPSLGFMLGDEGSGSYLGKRIVTDFLNQDLPQRLHEKFEKRYKTNKDEILENIYKKPFPNRYLAKYSQFLFHNLSDPYIYRLVYESFELFFKRNIFKYEGYKEHKIHFVGSVAFYYSNILRQVANDHGVHVRNILETPIAGLSLYHLDKIDN
jgi:glucosamine kinase